MLKTTLDTLLEQYEKSKKLSTKIKQKIISNNSSLEQKLKAYLDANDKLSDAKLIRIIQTHRLNKAEKKLAHAILHVIFGDDYLFAVKFISATILSNGEISNEEINFIKQLLKHGVLQAYLDAMNHLGYPVDMSLLNLRTYDIKAEFNDIFLPQIRQFYVFIQLYPHFSANLFDFIKMLSFLHQNSFPFPNNTIAFLTQINNYHQAVLTQIPLPRSKKLYSIKFFFQKIENYISYIYHNPHLLKDDLSSSNIPELIFGKDYLSIEYFIGLHIISKKEIDKIKSFLKYGVLPAYLDARSHLNLPPDKSELFGLNFSRYGNNIEALFKNVIYFYTFIKKHAIFSSHLHDFINALYILQLQMLTHCNARRFLMQIVKDELKSKKEIKADFFQNSARYILYLQDCNISIKDYLSFKHHSLSRVFIYVIKLITPYLLDLSPEVIAHIKQQDLSNYYQILYLLQENNLSPAIIQAIFYYPAAINDLNASLKKLKERALFQPSIITLVIAAQPEHPNFIVDLLSRINANIIYKNEDLLPHINEFFKCIKSYPHFLDGFGFYQFISGVNYLLEKRVVDSPKHILRLLISLANYENIPFTEQTQQLCGTRFLKAAEIFIYLHTNKLTLSEYLSYSKRNLKKTFIDAIKLLIPLFPNLPAETIAKIKQCELDKYMPIFYLLNKNKMLSAPILKIVFDSPPLLRALLNLTRTIKDSQEYIELVIKCQQDQELFVASLIALQNLKLLVTIKESLFQYNNPCAFAYELLLFHDKLRTLKFNDWSWFNEIVPSFIAQFNNLPLVITLLLRLCTVGYHEDCLSFLANKTELQIEAISRAVYLLTKVGGFTQEEYIKNINQNGRQKSASSRIPVTDAEFSAEQSTKSANSLENKLSTANSPEKTKSTPAQKLKKSRSSLNLFQPVRALTSAENIGKIDAHITNCL